MLLRAGEARHMACINLYVPRGREQLGVQALGAIPALPVLSGVILGKSLKLSLSSFSLSMKQG